MSESNPYQAPAADPLAVSAEGQRNSFRFDGKYLWVRDGARLPERCIYTNKSFAEDPDLRIVSKKIAWVNPLFALFLLLNVIVYLVISLCVQKKAHIQFLADRAVLKRKKLKVALGLLILVAMGALFIGGAILSSESDLGLLLVFAGIIGILAALIFSVRVGNAVRVTKYDDGWFRLAGCGKLFLDSLSVGEEG